MAHELFISHSAQNREVADAVCTAIEKAGIRCWVAPRDVRPGRTFPGEITRAIQQSKVMLLIFSSHSNNSEQVLREVQLATDARLPIVRFRIEDVALTDDLRYFLSSPHWLDALTPPLSNHIARLEVAIKELLGSSTEVSGKNVVDDPVQPEVSPVTPPAAAVAPSPAAPAMPPPPPPPRESIAPRAPEPIAPVPAAREREPFAKRSLTPWILLGVGVVVLFAAVLGVIFFVLLKPKPSRQQASTTSPPAAQTPEAKPTAAPPAARTAKVTRSPAPQPVESTKTAPPAETERSSEPAGVSAFERAGALRRPPSEHSALALDTLLAFNKAVQEKSFARFHREETSSTFRKQFTLEKFSAAFQVFIEKGYDISNIAKAEPVFDTPPAVDRDGVLVLKGHYAVKPNKVTFLLRYLREGSNWKVLGINVQAVPFVENTGTVPSNKEVKGLVLDSLLAFNRAIQAESFENFYGRIAELWRQETTPEKLQEIFQSFIDKGINISQIAKLDPAFDEPPAINADGFLVAKGSYTTDSSKVFFELKYVDQDGAWKLIGINVNVKPAGNSLGKNAADDE
ncbi:MAG TPA: TIR domain-containing protein [Chthoniobacterales bacterium]|nr:TIR domain-containing protein [Chthoniobacterales bacterium]